ALSNPWLLAGIGFSALLQFFIGHLPIMQVLLDIRPLSAVEWVTVISCALLPSLVAQVRKLFGKDMVR
ncbi:MAG TPA: cation transporting ATPase C-terminal domain-containing protein, partial [Synergistales bacterium]|nr:cation transporting ATPase C-terminal domain-containing protein [Synergistales bacterium]